MGRNYDYEKGQRDHNAGRWEKPHGLLDEIFSGPSQNRSGFERNRQYNSGWRNACDSAKRGR